jgi:hypothetical protein
MNITNWFTKVCGYQDSKGCFHLTKEKALESSFKRDVEGLFDAIIRQKGSNTPYHSWGLDPTDIAEEIWKHKVLIEQAFYAVANSEESICSKLCHNCTCADL